MKSPCSLSCFQTCFLLCYFLFVSLLVPGIKFYFPHIFFSSSVSTRCPHSHISMLIYCLSRPLHLVELSLVVMCHLVLICFEFFGGLLPTAINFYCLKLVCVSCICIWVHNSVVTQQYLTDCCFCTVFSFTMIYRIYRNLNVVIKPCNLKSLCLKRNLREDFIDCNWGHKYLDKFWFCTLPK